MLCKRGLSVGCLHWCKLATAPETSSSVTTTPSCKLQTTAYCSASVVKPSTVHNTPMYGLP